MNIDATNILCLHGCQQSLAVYQAILSDYIKIGQNKYNFKFHFLEGPYDHSETGRMWYCQELKIDDIGKTTYRPDMVAGCMDYLDRYIREHNIRVLMGFSQGGNVVDTYLRTRPNDIQCAVIVSGYSFVYGETEKLDVPLLNIYSPEDGIVPAKFRPSEYKTIQEICHHKGHKNPTQKSIIRQILDFIASNSQSKKNV